MGVSLSYQINDIQDRVKYFESRLPNVFKLTFEDVRVHESHIELSIKAKITRYREASIWRMLELSESAVDNFQADKLSSALILTRAAIETSAALWYS